MFNIDYSIVKGHLSVKKNIVIVTHKTPDGDALGSSLALFHALKSHHSVDVIVPNEYPYYLKWLPGNDTVMIYEGNENECDRIINHADIIFCLDFNKLYRTYTMLDVLSKNKACKIMIDHHEEPDSFCDQMLSNPSISSTAELIYEFLINIGCELNKNISISLYTGIITDTGSLKYPNVTQKTHQVVAELMSFDIDHSSIHRNLFDSQNKSRLELLKICLENLNILTHEKTAITFLKESDLIQCKYKKGDTEGFVNMPLSMKNVMFSAFFVEFKDGIKISFRSQGEFDVNLFSKTYFNGGGHKNASGGFIDHKEMNVAISYFKDSLKSYLKSI